MLMARKSMVYSSKRNEYMMPMPAGWQNNAPYQ